MPLTVYVPCLPTIRFENREDGRDVTVSYGQTGTLYVAWANAPRQPTRIDVDPYPMSIRPSGAKGVVDLLYHGRAPLVRVTGGTNYTSTLNWSDYRSARGVRRGLPLPVGQHLIAVGIDWNLDGELQGDEATQHCHVVVLDASVSIVSSPTDDWSSPLPEGHVLLTDEMLWVAIDIRPPVSSLSAITEAFGDTLRLKTPRSSPSGYAVSLQGQDVTLVDGGGCTQVRLSISSDKLAAVGLIPASKDLVNEKSWLDTATGAPGSTSTLADGELFGSALFPAELRGKSTSNGGLSADPPTSPIDPTFFLAAGCELVRASFGGGESEWRQVMNQSDTFYFSGHGFHVDGAVQLDAGHSVRANEAGRYWTNDLDVAIFACCSVLDINDYNGRFREDSSSPGEQWAASGPQTLLGYNASAPSDVTASVTVLQSWISLRTSQGDTQAWMSANHQSNAHNACAVDTSGYHYFRLRRTFGLAQWTRVVVPQSAW